MDAQAPVLPQIPTSVRSFERLWAVGCHLSIFAGIPVLIPLIILLVKKDDEFVANHARQALNFQISIAIYLAGLFALFLVLVMSLLGALLAFSILPIIIAVLFGAMILSVIATAVSANGEPYHYPLTIQIVR